ncbi:MAG TPA: hypothetical protein VFQ53_28795 [Kofleriaceae bacterium]|nr:hypothetical protein [Kofleriaceae bacterium]
MIKPALLALFAAFALSACVVRAAPPPAGPVAYGGWARLGERWVHGRADRDVIHVGRADGRFTRLQVVVEHSALEMYDMTIVFGDGSAYSPPLRMVFGQGTTSRVIDLPGGARVIRRVEFRYGNLPGGGRAQVELWGA